MYEIKLENLKGFLEVFTEQGEKYIEYYPYAEYEIIIDGRVLSHIYQDNRDNDMVEIFNTDDNASIPASWDYMPVVKINRITKQSLHNHSLFRVIVANKVGCLESKMIEKYVNIGDNLYYFIINKDKEYNKNIKNINVLGHNILFHDFDNRIVVEVKCEK